MGGISPNLVTLFTCYCNSVPTIPVRRKSARCSVNLIKHFNIVIYDPRVVWLENCPYYDSRVVSYDRKVLYNIGHRIQVILTGQAGRPCRPEPEPWRQMSNTTTALTNQNFEVSHLSTNFLSLLACLRATFQLQLSSFNTCRSYFFNGYYLPLSILGSFYRPTLL